jgi:hypothetical protein
MRSVEDLALGQAAITVTLVVRRAAVMATLAAGIVAHPVAGTELGPAGMADGMAASDGMVPAGTGGLLGVGSLAQLPPPVLIHIASFTTALTTTLTTILITGFHTPTTRDTLKKAENATVGKTKLLIFHDLESAAWNFSVSP